VVFVLRIRGDDTLDGRSTSSEEEAAEEGEDDLDEATVLVGAAAAIERRTMQPCRSVPARGGGLLRRSTRLPRWLLRRLVKPCSEARPETKHTMLAPSLTHARRCRGYAAASRGCRRASARRGPRACTRLIVPPREFTDILV
jgi:hypothetical protein